MTDEQLQKLIEKWCREDEFTMGIVAAFVSLMGLIGFVALVAWLAYH